MLALSFGTHRVSAIIDAPPRPLACFILAHGAGAGMKHPFLEAVAAGVCEHGIATLRFQFPYMERGSQRPDPPSVAHAAVRAAAAEAQQRFPELPLFAGGRSFGGRMTSQAQALSALPNVRGLAFIGFPLHPAKKPADDRGKHLFDIHVPMLFLQGTRDALAQLDVLEPLISRLGERACLHLFKDADHSFHVPARTGKSEDVRAALIEALARWIQNRAR